MDTALLFQHSQYAVPVVIVLICAILVFVFGFKKAEQPPFAQLSVNSDLDRKFVNKKRGKTKEKKTTNGQVINEKASPIKKTTVSKPDGLKRTASKMDDTEGKGKEKKQEEKISPKEKSQIEISGVKENKVEQVKNKKNFKNLVQEKPVDFDDGDWEQALSRKEKKNKKKEDETPSKKVKKNTKKADIINEAVAKQKELEKPEIKDKVAKNTENMELKEKDQKEVILTPISKNEETKEDEICKEEHNMIEISVQEEKKSGKSKKLKKTCDEQNTSISIPCTPKIDNKSLEKIIEKEMDNIEKVDNSEDCKVEQKNILFNELGDAWTEAKPQKKSKKKARKDN